MTVLKSLKPKAVITFGVLIWCALIVFLLFQLVSDRMIIFDDGQQVRNEYETTERYLDEIAKVFELEPSGSIRVVRVIKPGCSCNFASSLHWEQLQSQYSHLDFTEVTLKELDDAIVKLVPATPMAIVFDAQGTVLYAGPFSDANYCNAENSLIEAYLNRSLSQRYSPLGTEGCYCKNR